MRRSTLAPPFTAALAVCLGAVACTPAIQAPVTTVTMPAPVAAPQAVSAAPSPPKAPMPTMDLPTSSDLLAQQVVLVVELDPNGNVAVDRQKVSTDAALSDRVRRAVEKGGPGLRAIIKADRAVTYGQLIHVMDLMRQAGVIKFAFGVAAQAP
jgi:biopolymer transport protein ExbD